MNHDQISWRQRLTRAAPYLLLLVGAYLLYAQSFGHQWTMDDHVVVTGNADIRSLSGFLADSYPGRPLRESTYLLDNRMFGDQPAGYHLQNIFWHGLNACLLALLARALGLAQPLAWLAGLLFLVHPLNVEVVANISHRKESLMLAFVLLALLAFLKSYQGERRRLWLGAAAVALFVACQARQTAVGLVPVMLGYDLWIAPPERRPFSRRSWVAWAVAAAALAGVCAWYLIAWNSPGFQNALQSCLIKMNVYSGQSGALFVLFVLKALAVSPTSTTALLGLGAAYLNQGQLPEAQAVLERGAMNFNDSKALYLLVITYERQGNQQGAISYYRRFVQMNKPRYAKEVANARRQLLRYGVAM